MCDDAPSLPRTLSPSNNGHPRARIMDPVGTQGDLFAAAFGGYTLVGGRKRDSSGLSLFETAVLIRHLIDSDDSVVTLSDHSSSLGGGRASSFRSPCTVIPVATSRSMASERLLCSTATALAQDARLQVIFFVCRQLLMAVRKRRPPSESEAVAGVMNLILSVVHTSIGPKVVECLLHLFVVLVIGPDYGYNCFSRWAAYAPFNEIYCCRSLLLRVLHLPSAVVSCALPVSGEVLAAVAQTLSHPGEVERRYDLESIPETNGRIQHYGDSNASTDTVVVATFDSPNAVGFGLLDNDDCTTQTGTVLVLRRTPFFRSFTTTIAMNAGRYASALLWEELMLHRADICRVFGNGLGRVLRFLGLRGRGLPGSDGGRASGHRREVSVVEADVDAPTGGTSGVERASTSCPSSDGSDGRHGHSARGRRGRPFAVKGRRLHKIGYSVCCLVSRAFGGAVARWMCSDTALSEHFGGLVAQGICSTVFLIAVSARRV